MSIDRASQQPEEERPGFKGFAGKSLLAARIRSRIEETYYMAFFFSFIIAYQWFIVFTLGCQRWLPGSLFSLSHTYQTSSEFQLNLKSLLGLQKNPSALVFLKTLLPSFFSSLSITSPFESGRPKSLCWPASKDRVCVIFLVSFLVSTMLKL